MVVPVRLMLVSLSSSGVAVMRSVYVFFKSRDEATQVHLVKYVRS